MEAALSAEAVLQLLLWLKRLLLLDWRTSTGASWSVMATSSSSLSSALSSPTGSDSVGRMLNAMISLESGRSTGKASELVCSQRQLKPRGCLRIAMQSNDGQSLNRLQRGSELMSSIAEFEPFPRWIAQRSFSAQQSAIESTSICEIKPSGCQLSLADRRFPAAVAHAL